MTIFDYVLLLIMGVSIAISVVRGLVREVLSLASWIGAFLVAKFGAPVVASWLPGAVSHPNVRLGMGFVLVLVATVLLFSLLSLQIAKVVKITGLTGTDRTLGALFGLARGCLIAMIAVLFGGLTPLPQERYWREAMFSAPLQRAATWIAPVLPDDIRRRISFERGQD
jgi:membrane protein required for colicin V production